MKKMDFYAAHAMVEDMMHSTNAPFVCLLKMGNLSSMMCNNVLLTDVLVTLMAHAWDSMRKHENNPQSSAKALITVALGIIGCGTDLEEHPELIPYEDIRHKVKSGMLSGRSLVVLLKRYGMRWSQKQAAEAMEEKR